MGYFSNRKLVNCFNRRSITGMKQALREGADINYSYEGLFEGKKRTVLFMAVEEGQYDIARFLLENGADVEGAQRVSSFYLLATTPLVRACENNNLEMVDLLLKHNAEVNKKNINRETALHYAVRAENLEMVKLLVEAGADIRVSNYNNMQPIDIARTLENSGRILEFLEEVEKKLRIKEAKVDAGWKMISYSEISHTSKNEAIGYSLSEVFNFASNGRTYTTIYKNLVDGRESHSVKSFDEFGDKRKIAEAYDRFIERGGKADRCIIFGKKKILDKKTVNKKPGNF